MDVIPGAVGRVAAERAGGRGAGEGGGKREGGDGGGKGEGGGKREGGDGGGKGEGGEGDDVKRKEEDMESARNGESLFWLRLRFMWPKKL